MFGIDATNSNVSSINNVFQNSQRVYFCPKCYYLGGTAIKTTVNTNLNARLDMSATGTYSTNYSVGNRFWDCHRAVEATDLYKLDCNYATFRSTQTTTNATSALVLPGSYGITNNTNRFSHTIKYNNFNNINNAVALNVYSGTYTYASSSYSGILAGDVLINHNYLGAQLTSATSLTTGLSGSAFLNNAINLSSASTTGWQFVGSIGLQVAQNEIDRAWRGAYVDAFAYAAAIETNTINLLSDATLSLTQHGIHAGNTQYVSVTNNTLNAANTTNTLVTLVYVGASPNSAVTCNTLNTSYNGFDFNSNCAVSTWRGNDMTSHTRGFVISNNGKISQQGGGSAPIDNKWNGTWTGGNNGTYVDASSDASNSILWVKNTGVWFPPNWGGPIPSQTYSVLANTPTTTGTYSCGSSPPPQRLIAPQSPSANTAREVNAITSEQFISDNIIYRFLHANPSLKNSDPAYMNFYNSKVGSSIDLFTQTETAIDNGQLAQAQNLNGSVTIDNNAEANYRDYYTLYTKYKQGNLTGGDSSALLGLAQLCPGIDGTIVYQARSLYNLVHKTVKVFKENCNEDSNLANAKITNETKSNIWSIELFPNPTKGNFTLVSKKESEGLNVTIRDITGKLIYNNTLNTSNFIANLELNATAGVYLITIKNSTHEIITKKLVIAD